MEKYIKISTTDDMVISGILNSKQSSSKLVVFVHGLTGSSTEAHYYAGYKYFNEVWFDTFRFKLYAGWDHSRTLETSSIAKHAIDTQKVLEYFAGIYDEVYVVGHSLWWPSIAWVQSFPKNVKGLILWDPAFDTSTTILRCFEKGGMYLYCNARAKNIEISKEMYDEFQSNTHLSDLENINFDLDKTSIIFAWRCDKIEFKDQTDALWIESCIIQWANHWFTQEWKYEELFEKTLEYINKK